jgi:hypothetical protein
MVVLMRHAFLSLVLLVTAAGSAMTFFSAAVSKSRKAGSP